MKHERERLSEHGRRGWLRVSVAAVVRAVRCIRRQRREARWNWRPWETRAEAEDRWNAGR